MNNTLFPLSAKSPRIPWLSVWRRTMVSQCCRPGIGRGSLMESIFPNSRCLSQSVPDPYRDSKWKGQNVQVQEHLSAPLRFLLDGALFFIFFGFFFFPEEEWTREILTWSMYINVNGRCTVLFEGMEYSSSCPHLFLFEPYGATDVVFHYCRKCCGLARLLCGSMNMAHWRNPQMLIKYLSFRKTFSLT